MIDKSFYLENLSAFDILIQDEDRQPAEALIFRVFSMLQRDKIWLREVATEEEISEEDTAFLEEIEEELNELDKTYAFGFEAFYKLVQQKLKNIQSKTDLNDREEQDFTFADDFDAEGDNDFEEEDDDFYNDIDDDEEEDEDEEVPDLFSHLSDEELDLITVCILESAKTRFNFPEFVQTFPQANEVFVENDFLLPFITGKAYGETDTEIAEKMISYFLSRGFHLEKSDLLKRMEVKSKQLGLEILAFRIAVGSLHQGAHPTAVVRQISQFLNPLS